MSRPILSEIIEFTKTLPDWQKVLAVHLLDSNSSGLSDEDVVSKCFEMLVKTENTHIEKVQDLDFPSLRKVVAENDCTKTKNFRLSKIENVTNLNALSSNQFLEIGTTGITAIFGENGVGKSGYGRLFNSVFYSRGDSGTLGNIFGPQNQESFGAKFEFIDLQDKIVRLSFPADRDHIAFQQFTCFDTKSVSVHIDNQNSLHISPTELDFFENLTRLIGKVAEKINAQIFTKKRQNEFISLFNGDSEIKTKIAALSIKSKPEDLEKFIQNDHSTQTDLEYLEVQKSSLNLAELEKSKKRLLAVKNSVLTIKSKIEECETKLSAQSLEKIKNAIEAHAKLTKEATELSVENFKDPRFFGIGSSTWKEFIEKGHKFEIENKVAEQGYKNEHNLCPYCRQNLTDDAAKLLENYQLFLSSEAENRLRKEDEWRTKQKIEIGHLNFQKIQDDYLFSDWCKTNFSDDFDTIVAASSNLNFIIKNILNALDNWSLDQILEPFCAKIEWKELVDRIENEIFQLNEKEIQIQRGKLETQIIFLKHQIVLKEQLPKIKLFVAGLIEVDRLEQLKKETNKTAPITNKALDLYKSYVNNGYVQSFKEECIEFGIPPPELKPSGEKANTKRSFLVGGQSPGKILSEGEQRAVALADFFTEANICDFSGLIFDDPVNSLDHNRKEQIAKRIAKESKKRQVIVFTHDLTFLNDLVSAADELKAGISFCWMEKNNSSETGIIFNGTMPDIDKSFVDGSFAKKRLSDAKSAQNPAVRLSILKDGFSGLRTSYEAFVVKVIFNKVIERFRRNVSYHDLLHVHAPKEILNFIHEKLVFLSGYVSAHFPVAGYTHSPSVTDLENEIAIFEKFTSDFKSSKAKANNEYSESIKNGSIQKHRVILEKGNQPK